jgi:hypothetical protein
MQCVEPIMKQPLMRWTKVVLATSAVVQFIFGAAALFSQSLWNSVFMPSPLPPSEPVLLLQFFGLLFLTNSFGAVYALIQDNWIAARMYLAINGPFVALSILITVIAALTPPGIPFILYLYILLAVLYVPQVVWVWRRESARQVP